MKKYLKKSKLIRQAHKHVVHNKAKLLRTLDSFKKPNNASAWEEYINFALNNQLDKTNFVPFSNQKYSGKSSKKIIAYYLPQYYQIKQNDEWFGRGFTEWSNVTKAVPQFSGHWQPHLPIDVGFYNLETTKIMHRQVELAKTYGISGFCFYYYWFSGGEKIMEKPINNWLKDKDLDFPFMLFWANEDWTNTWGESADLGTKTYSAKMKKTDVEKFVKDILPFLSDKRYITIDGRPHIIIYQPIKDPYLPTFIKEIKNKIQQAGINKPFISLVFPDTFDEDFDPRNYGADGAVEFGAHLKTMPQEIKAQTTNEKIINPLAKLTEYDMEGYINSDQINPKTSYPLFKGAMTYFDNTARKIYTGAQLFEISPELYQKWLYKSLENSSTDQVFVTAWNEWAEGMHLEPDHKYGYAYLQATRNALENFENKK
ncbi:glycoside hydrolase family 99-like domain-containing protein [Candidatus Saccharibacteria bacterium]|nr:glycoside hydrolase family 99-like domain-containing protein [Candidatus Saccharibacteria bacterium]